MPTSRTSEHNESSRRRQVPPMPRYAETLGLRRASQSNDWQLFRVDLEFARHIDTSQDTGFVNAETCIDHQDEDVSRRLAAFLVLWVLICALI